MTKLLIIGNGKLCKQLKNVLGDTYDITVYSISKPAKIYENFFDFPIVINTAPSPVTPATMFNDKQVIYELASKPYGISGDVSGLDYRILPSLPGKFYPAEALKIVMDFKVKHYDFFAKDDEFISANNLLTARAVKSILNGADPSGAPAPIRPTIVLCVTGSSCCFTKLLPCVRELQKDFNIIPVLSPNATLQNRFGDIEKFKTDLRECCVSNIITTIAGAETLASNRDIAASVVLPATGNTIAKLANAVTDTCVTMAVKALLRNNKPCIVGISTNDALSGNASNIGVLLNRKNYFFVPFTQDDFVNKPYSMVCNFGAVGETIKLALNGRQIQPIVLCSNRG